MTTVKYNGGKARCKCGGDYTYDATITDKLPMGFGFVNGRFQIDAIKRTGFRGQCLECDTVVFAVKSQRHVVSFPKLGKKRRAR